MVPRSAKGAAVKAMIVGLVLTLVGLGQLDVSSAFEHRRFHVHGYVQWIAGEKLMLLTDAGGAIAIDLSEADQAAYHALEQGEGITVSARIEERAGKKRNSESSTPSSETRIRRVGSNWL